MILTGPSHSGKTSIARRLFESLPRPVAYLSLDDLVERALRGTEPDPWTQIPLAYHLLEVQASALLERHWFVMLESTFTYVGPDGNGEMHREAVDSLLAIARSRGAPAFIVRLRSPTETLLERAASTGRIDASIVGETARLHAEADFPESLEVDTGEAGPDAAAAAVRAWVQKRLLSSPAS